MSVSKRKNKMPNNDNSKRQSWFEFGIALLIVVFVNIIGAFLFGRLDLTDDHRYSLSKSTKELLKGVDEPILFRVYLDGSDLRDARVSDNLGSVQVYITGPENYNGGGVITVTENMGIIKLHIPSEWYVVTRAADNLGRCYIPPQKEAREKSITLVVTDNLGTINVEFD